MPNGKLTLIYTDGSFLHQDPNRAGGWAWIAVDPSSDHILNEDFGGYIHTTANRMELMAAIKALEAMPKDAGVDYVVATDSKYLVNGGNEWSVGWKKRGWRRNDGGEIRNADLWRRLDALRETTNFRFQWVSYKGGNPLNEHVDKKARDGSNKAAFSAHPPVDVSEGVTTPQELEFHKVRELVRTLRNTLDELDNLLSNGENLETIRQKYTQPVHPVSSPNARRRWYHLFKRNR